MVRNQITVSCTNGPDWAFKIQQIDHKGIQSAGNVKLQMDLRLTFCVAVQLKNICETWLKGLPLHLTTSAEKLCETGHSVFLLQLIFSRSSDESCKMFQIADGVEQLLQSKLGSLFSACARQVPPALKRTSLSIYNANKSGLLKLHWDFGLTSHMPAPRLCRNSVAPRCSWSFASVWQNIVDLEEEKGREGGGRATK